MVPLAPALNSTSKLNWHPVMGNAFSSLRVLLEVLISSENSGPGRPVGASISLLRKSFGVIRVLSLDEMQSTIK